MSGFEDGDRVRIDIPDEADPDHERLHGTHGHIVAVFEDDAGRVTNDERDTVLYRVELDSGETVDVRHHDVRPPLKDS
jgi:ribosomal protein L21E